MFIYRSLTVEAWNKMRDRLCYSQKSDQSFCPAISWLSQIMLQSAGHQTTPETEQGNTETKRRERQCRAGKTDASSVSEIWQMVIRQLSVQVQTQDSVWVSMCVVFECVCVLWHAPVQPHRGLMRKFNQLNYTESLGAVDLTVLCNRSVLWLARQGWASGQHG